MTAKDLNKFIMLGVEIAKNSNSDQEIARKVKLAVEKQIQEDNASLYQ